MATPQQPSVDTQLQQLKDARNIVLKQPDYWPQVLTTTLPVIASPVIELRRWGADFLAESFATPMIEPRAKQELALACLDTLLQLAEEKETGILKSVVQCSASVYPIIFRHICSNRNDAETWKKMSAIKSRILSLWDIAPIGVRICCIKFVQRVVLVQSRGVTDPRLVDRSDISLATVPSSHPLLSLPSLDAEAQGLLDRLLSILQDDPPEPTLVTAAVNNLAHIIKTRPPLASKVLGAAMAFNPFQRKQVTVESRLMMLSMEKTIRALLLNIARSNPQGPYVGRITQHLQRLSAAKAEMNEEMSRKRSAPTQDHEAKRAKTGKPIPGRPNATPTPTPTPPPPPPVQPAQQVITGPMTYAQLYTLATDPAMANFDGKQLPLDLVLQIVIGSLYSVNQDKLNMAVAAIKDRYTALLNVPVPPSATPTSSQLAVRNAPPDNVARAPEERPAPLAVSEFKLPPPPKLTPQQLQLASVDSLNRMFSVIDDLKKTSLTARDTKLGLQRLAATNWDREGWVSVLTRLATRAPIPSDEPTPETQGNELARPSDTPTNFPDTIRHRLYTYVISDFRARMDVAVAWLNEEWYNDRIHASDPSYVPQYHKWMMKVMEGIFPFVEAKDRVVIRMLSEIPELSRELLEKVKMLCLDPDRQGLGIQMLLYLALLRPPVREEVMDVAEDLWRNHPEVKGVVEAKFLKKWRPGVLVEQEDDPTNGVQDGEVKQETMEEVKQEPGANGAQTS